MRFVDRIEVSLLYSKTVLHLPLDNKDRSEIVDFLAKPIDPEKEYDVIIQPRREHRSRNANAYMWALADQIADAVRSTKEEVYRKAVREVGVFRDMAVQAAICEDVVQEWAENGIGWFAEVFDSKLVDASGDQMKRVRFYKGSSKYNSKQMSRLIDWIVEEAKGLGIETLPPAELARMVEEVDHR